MKPSRTSCRPSGSKTLRTRASSGSRVASSSQTAEEGPQQPLPRAVDAALGDRQQHLARVDRRLRARRGTGRPWCRSSGAPAPRRPRPRPAIARTDVPAYPWPRTAAGPRPGSSARVSGEPGRRPRRTGWTCRQRRTDRDRSARGGREEVLAGELQRLAQVLLPLVAVGGLAGVDLDARSRRGSRCARRGAGTRRRRRVPRPGTRCSSLAEPLPSVRWMCRSRRRAGRPSRSGRRRRSRRARGRWWCWRRARPTGPSRAGTSPCRASTRRARDTCSRPRRRCRSTPRGPRCR